jgi:putative FmdB family regulatory protein
MGFTIMDPFGRTADTEVGPPNALELGGGWPHTPRMPIYEFACKQCGKESELLVPRVDWKGTRCPECGSTRLAKKLSVFAVSGAHASTGGAPGPACSGNPSACGRCTAF